MENNKLIFIYLQGVAVESMRMSGIVGALKRRHSGSAYGSSACVRINGTETDWFNIKSSGTSGRVFGKYECDIE